MTTKITPAARIVVAAFLVVTVLLFLALGARFGGPSLSVSSARHVHTAVADAQGLPTQADVLVHGVKVGRVTHVRVAGDRTLVDMALTSAPTLHADAWVRIGSKTPLGEPFVELAPGTRGTFDTHRALPVRASVEVDEALGLLAPRTRADLRAVLHETGIGVTSAEDVSGTILGLDRATRELRRLGAVLRGQDGDVGATIASSRAVLDELGAHDAALRGLVADGLTTLQATAGRPDDLRAALTKLPDVLQRARATLTEAEPLIRDARPVVADVRAAAAPLADTLHTAVPVVRDARALVDDLPALRRSALPTLLAARQLLPIAGPAFARLGPTLANFVPMLRYLSQRTDTIAAWFSNTSALGQNGDSRGKWARFFILFDPSTALGVPGAGSPKGNSYTLPHDALANRAYAPGDFPRLTALPRP